MHNAYRLLVIGYWLLSLFSCSHIDENERLIEVESPANDQQPAAVTKNVLLEEFTGQQCSNCPTASEVIEQLHQDYGNRLIAVAIHGGPYGFAGNASTTGLSTSVGDDYYGHWNLEYQPVGLIDRGGAMNYMYWIGEVKKAMERSTDISMEVHATINGETIDITVGEEVLTDSYTGRLQVWVVEDGIVAVQKMPDDTIDRQYVHNHVLRVPVNGTWGEDILLVNGTPLEQTLSCAISDSWQKERLSIVAFVYNEDGVAQTVKTKIIYN